MVERDASARRDYIFTSAQHLSNALHRPNDLVQKGFHAWFHAYSCASPENPKAAAHLRLLQRHFGTLNFLIKSN